MAVTSKFYFGLLKRVTNLYRNLVEMVMGLMPQKQATLCLLLVWFQFCRNGLSIEQLGIFALLSVMECDTVPYEN